MLHNSSSLSISQHNSLDISESSNIFEDDLSNTKMQHLERFDTLIVGHLIINSIRNKFEMVAETITNFDIFLMSKSKIDSTFPNMQIKINEYKLRRHNCNRFCGRLMLYLNKQNTIFF